jgi:hypothetical protein
MKYISDRSVFGRVLAERQGINPALERAGQ